MLFVFFPFGKRDLAFALIADIDDHKFLFNPDNPAGNDVVGREVIADNDLAVDFFVAERLRQFDFPIFFVRVKTVNQVTIYHNKIPGGLLFLYPFPPYARREQHTKNMMNRGEPCRTTRKEKTPRTVWRSAPGAKQLC